MSAAAAAVVVVLVQVTVHPVVAAQAAIKQSGVLPDQAQLALEIMVALVAQVRKEAAAVVARLLLVKTSRQPQAGPVAREVHQVSPAHQLHMRVAVEPLARRLVVLAVAAAEVLAQQPAWVQMELLTRVAAAADLTQQMLARTAAAVRLLFV